MSNETQNTGAKSLLAQVRDEAAKAKREAAKAKLKNPLCGLQQGC